MIGDRIADIWHAPSRWLHAISHHWPWKPATTTLVEVLFTMAERLAFEERCETAAQLKAGESTEQIAAMGRLRILLFGRSCAYHSPDRSACAWLGNRYEKPASS